jgi:flavin reductase (DIM6/NTAB) family NADH-FMN oxidoreductase RutF
MTTLSLARQASLREPIDLPRAYRLLNHGPTALVSSRHGGRDNVMAAAWVMPVDFTPCKVSVVIDKSTFTRTLIDASGVFALNLPCVAIADAAYAAGTFSGHTTADKFAACGLERLESSLLDVPLVEGCVAWLECRVIAQSHDQQVQQSHDLFIAEVVAAQADPRVFTNGRWHFDGHDALRTLHHLSGGAFVVAGEMVQAARPGG